MYSAIRTMHGIAKLASGGVEFLKVIKCCFNGRVDGSGKAERLHALVAQSTHTNSALS